VREGEGEMNRGAPHMNQAVEIPGKNASKKILNLHKNKPRQPSDHNSVLVDNLPDGWANKEGCERFSFFSGWAGGRERWKEERTVLN
jgi:hypothetical protein